MTTLQYRCFHEPTHLNFEQMDVLREKIASILEYYPLSEEEREQLKECYVQENTIASASIRLNKSHKEVVMWYYRISLMLTRRALLESCE